MPRDCVERSGYHQVIGLRDATARSSDERAVLCYLIAQSFMKI